MIPSDAILANVSWIRQYRACCRSGFPAPVTFFVTLLAIGCATPHGPNTSTPSVRIALTNVPLAYLPVILAEELGYYRQEGLAVTIEDLSSASKVMQALLGGSADVAAGSYEQDIQMAAEGRPVKSFVLMLRAPTRALVVAPNRVRALQRIEDLKGAVIGVAGVGSINHLFLNYVLLKHRLAPEDVKVVAIATGASAVAAIEHGRVDAAVLSGSEPTVVMKRCPGASILLDARGAVGSQNLYGVDVYPGAVLHATDRWLKHNPETARRVAQSIQKTLTWIHEHSPEQIWAAMPKRYQSVDKGPELEALRITLPSFSKDGIMPPQGAEVVRKAQAFVSERVRTASFDTSQTYTNKFVEHNEKRR